VIRNKTAPRTRFLRKNCQDPGTMSESKTGRMLGLAEFGEMLLEVVMKWFQLEI
jgi:hypothetical protein